MILRPYQVQMIDKVREHIHNGYRSVLLQSPTGSGKTLIMAHMAKTANAQGMSMAFIVHRRELVRQSVEQFSGIDIGVIAKGWPERFSAPTHICSIQLLARRLTRLKQPTLIAWDECHHLAAGSWEKIYKAFPSAFHVGLTATPERLDGRGLGGFFQVMVEGPSVSSLIEQGYLSHYKLYAPSTIDLSGVHKRMGDYARDELSVAADKPTITGDSIKEYLKLANGKRAVVFCCSIQHSQHVTDAFNAAGVRAEHVDGETPVATRDAAIERFKSGETKILSNVELFGEGFDLPAIEVAILLRPTQSLGLYLQQVGRCLRPSPGKENAIILDHSGNCQRHGLPDEDRVWTLAGRGLPKMSHGAFRSVRVCPKCFAASLPGPLACGYCGYTFEVQAREVEQKEGELAEVDIARLKKEMAFRKAKAQTYEELVEEGKRRGYPRAELWARHVFNSRQRRTRI